MIDRDLATAQILEVLEYHSLRTWTVAWTNAKRAFGSCHHATETIRLSWPIAAINTPDQLHATVLHEIAHAKAGPTAGHGPAWRRQCRLLGIPPMRCVGPDVTVPPGRWIGTCPTCGWQASRLQLRTAARAGSCPRCDRAYNPDFRLTWTRNPHFDSDPTKPLDGYGLAYVI